VSLRNNHKLFVGNFYRPPNGNASNQLDELEKSLYFISNKIRNNPNHTVMLVGDFNLGDIEWDSETVDPKSTQKSASDKLIHLLRDHQLSQMQREHTRENRLLDLFCTTNHHWLSQYQRYLEYQITMQLLQTPISNLLI